MGLADADPSLWVLWSAPGALVVAASGTMSLLPGCDVGVVGMDGDPVGGETEVLPGLVELIGPWTGELEEEGGCLVAHEEGETAQSLELWEGSVLGTGALTAVLGKGSKGWFP